MPADRPQATRGTRVRPTIDGASRDPRIADESFLPCDANDLRQPLALELEHASAERRHSVIASTLVVVGRAPTLRGVFDERRAQHPLNGAVERARAHVDLVVRGVLDLLRDRIA